MYNVTDGCAIYSETVGTDPVCGQTTKIVVGLLARCGLLGKGNTVFLDYYYNSPELADELDLHDTYICGTIRKTCKQMPKIFSQVKLKAGDAIFQRRGNTLVIKYHDSDMGSDSVY